MNTSSYVGRIIKTPKLRTVKGVTFVNFFLSVPDDYVSWKSDLIHFRAFGGTAEHICKYFKKDDWIAIEGKTKRDKYINQFGHEQECQYEQVIKVHFVGYKDGRPAFEFDHRTDKQKEVDRMIDTINQTGEF